MEAKKERVAKIIARSGVCSRREAEKLIEQKRVTVNNETIETPATTVSLDDVIKIDGEKISKKEKTRVWLFHKTVDLVTTHKDEKGRTTVFDVLPSNMPRVISVGRLDINSEGLLLLTNDGELSRKLELPSNGWSRKYKVRVHGRINQQELENLSKGVTIDGVTYGSIKVEIETQKGANTWLLITLHEGKNREIRKVLNHLNLEVSRLIRVSYGPFQLGALKKNEVKEVAYKVLKEQLGSKYEI